MRAAAWRGRSLVRAFKIVLARQLSLEAFIAEWNATAHPFRWKVSSFDKVRAKCQSVTGRAA